MDSGGQKRAHVEMMDDPSPDDADPGPGRGDVLADGFPLSQRGQDMVARGMLIMHTDLARALAARPLLPAEPPATDATRLIDANDAVEPDGSGMSKVRRPLLSGCSAAEACGPEAWRDVTRYLGPRDMARLGQCSRTLYAAMRNLLHEWKLCRAPPSSPLVWTDEQYYVYNHVVVQRRPLFLTGPAGAGKTVLMRWLMRVVIAYTDLVYSVAASTGVAAIPLDGKTLHSLLGVGAAATFPALGCAYERHHARVRSNRALAELDILFIEEPGMISDRLMRYLDDVLRASTGQRDAPFGGVAVVFCGDFSQLPPIADNADVAHSGAGRGRDAERPYAFRTDVWRAAFRDGVNVLVLNRSFRQLDTSYRELLDRVRNGTVTQADMARLHARVPAALDKVDPPSAERLASEWAQLPAASRPPGGKDAWCRQQREAYARRVLDTVSDQCVVTTGRRESKSMLDNTYLERLPGTHPIVWPAESVGTAVDQKRMPLRRNLRLKTTAAVMLTVNSRVAQCHVDAEYTRNGCAVELANGATGTVVEIVSTHQRATEVLAYGALVVAPHGAFSQFSIHPEGHDAFVVHFRPLRPWALPADPVAAALQQRHGCTPVQHIEVRRLIMVHFRDANITALMLPAESRLSRIHVHTPEAPADDGSAPASAADTSDGVSASIGGGRRRRRSGPKSIVVHVCQGSRVQFPLCLARATTAHKTQGATLEKSAVMLNECFEIGHPYVMLSRVRCIDDLTVLNHRFGIRQFQERAARAACEYQASLLAPGSKAAVVGMQQQ